MRLIHGDCLKTYTEIDPESVDLILTDPPYGTVKGLNLDGWDQNRTGWDDALATADIFNLANTLLRKNGKLILFSQEPYTSILIREAIPNIPFCYRMIWKKDHFANSLSCKKAPVKYFEDVLVFSKKNPLYDFTHPLRDYFRKVHNFIGVSKSEIIKKIGQRADHAFRYNSSQFSFCTKEVYNALENEYYIELMPEYFDYEILAEIDAPYKSNVAKTTNLINPSIFNLKEGTKFTPNTEACFTFRRFDLHFQQ
jgi:hypothetical protein